MDELAPDTELVNKFEPLIATASEVETFLEDAPIPTPVPDEMMEVTNA